MKILLQTLTERVEIALRRPLLKAIPSKMHKKVNNEGKSNFDFNTNR